MIMTKKEILAVISKKWSDDVIAVVFNKKGHEMSVLIQVKYSVDLLYDFYVYTFENYSNILRVNGSLEPNGDIQNFWIEYVDIDYGE